MVRGIRGRELVVMLLNGVCKYEAGELKWFRPRQFHERRWWRRMANRKADTSKVITRFGRGQTLLRRSTRLIPYAFRLHV